MKKPMCPGATRADRATRLDERIRFWNEWANTRSLTKEDLDFDWLRNLENDLERQVCFFYEYGREDPATLAAVEWKRGDDPEYERILAEGQASAWGNSTLPHSLFGLCAEWPTTPWLLLPAGERKRIVNMMDHPLANVPKFEPDEIGFGGMPVFRTQHSFSDDDWEALAWFRENPDWPAPFKMVRDGERKRIFAVLNLDCSEPPGKHGKRLEEWLKACVREAGLQQRDWRKGRKSARLQDHGLDGSPLDLLRALAAFRLHRRQKNFTEASKLSVKLVGKEIYANERKWQAAIRKAREALQIIFPVPE